MRGIVELECLKAIETELPVGIPVRSFFDLIVGTRFVHTNISSEVNQISQACLLEPVHALYLQHVIL